MKVFGIGLNKTGTKTLSKALSTLGFVNTPSLDLKNSPKKRWELTTDWSKNRLNSIVTFSADYNNFEDWPWPLVYKEMAEEYHDAKFILTVRKSSEVWFNSLCKHAKNVSDNKFEKLIYGYHMPHDFKKEHICFYEDHNKKVISFFKQYAPERLLIVCFEEGDSWDKICAFLNKKSPTKPFPHANNSTDIVKISNPHLVKFVKKIRTLKNSW